jgi:hypothetical protein
MRATGKAKWNVRNQKSQSHFTYLCTTVASQMRFVPKCIRVRRNAVITKTKCISFRPKCIWGQSSTRNAFRDGHADFRNANRSQMHLRPNASRDVPNGFSFSPSSSGCIWTQRNAHLDVTKCISLCHEMRTHKNCKYQPQYIIRFHAAVVNAIN